MIHLTYGAAISNYDSVIEPEERLAPMFDSGTDGTWFSADECYGEVDAWRAELLKV